MTGVLPPTGVPPTGVPPRGVVGLDPPHPPIPAKLPGKEKLSWIH